MRKNRTVRAAGGGVRVLVNWRDLGGGRRSPALLEGQAWTPPARRQTLGRNTSPGSPPATVFVL